MLKVLSNRREIEVFKQLSPIADSYRADVYRKFEVADVVDIGRFNASALGSYALKAHFDFVITDEN